MSGRQSIRLVSALIFLMVIPWTDVAAQTQSVTRSWNQSARGSDANYFGIVGHVVRPGVYELPSRYPTLVELVQRAGGLTKDATSQIRVVRNGANQLRAWYSPGSRFPLQRGDVVVVDSASNRGQRSSDPASNGVRNSQADRMPSRQLTMVQLAFVNLFDHPVVLTMSRDEATLAHIMARLGQRPDLVRTLRVIQSVTARQQQQQDGDTQATPLTSGTVLVFDPSTVDYPQLPELPRPFPTTAPEPITGRPQSIPRPVSPLVAGPFRPYARTMQPPAGQSGNASMPVEELPAPEQDGGESGFARASDGKRSADRERASESNRQDDIASDSRRQLPEEEPGRIRIADLAPAEQPDSISPDASAPERLARQNPTDSASDTSSTSGREGAGIPAPADTGPRVQELAEQPHSERPEVVDLSDAADLVGIADGATRQERADALSGRALSATASSVSPATGSAQRTEWSVVGVYIAGAAALAIALGLLWSMARHEAMAVERPVQQTERKLLDALIDNKLPLSEEPLRLSSSLEFYGRPVQRKTLRVDAAHEPRPPHVMPHADETADADKVAEETTATNDRKDTAHAHAPHIRFRPAVASTVSSGVIPDGSAVKFDVVEPAVEPEPAETAVAPSDGGPSDLLGRVLSTVHGEPQR